MALVWSSCQNQQPAGTLRSLRLKASLHHTFLHLVVRLIVVVPFFLKLISFFLRASAVFANKQQRSWWVVGLGHLKCEFVTPGCGSSLRSAERSPAVRTAAALLRLMDVQW